MKSLIKKPAVAACVFLAVIASVGVLNTGKRPGNIAYAMVMAFEQVQSIAGLLEYRNEVGGTLKYAETTSFKFKSPDKFAAVSTFNNSTLTKTYDGGEKMYSVWSEEPGKVRVQYMDSEMLSTQLQWFLLKNMAQTLMENENAVEQKPIKGELVAGRPTYGYEITFNHNGLITIQRVWVDKQLNLPLKWEITYPGFTTEEGKIISEEKIITYFVNIEINPELNDEIFIFKLEPHQEYDISTDPDEGISAPDQSGILNHEELKKIPYSFTYRDRNNNLRLVNFAESTDEILTDNVSRYAINEKHNLVAYVLSNDNSYYGELVLFDMAKKVKKVIILDERAALDS